ncbi:non-ribosomal peptide synthetase/type I polyketide synthase [Maridesulfovibrio sp.]|uniref:non-ribosomal peptide synthetase/type I polyketide synthase n=1 Tax=Maridesulfovibrio sp. TaxID=2795000 RepID=UPI002A18D088|nr:non-ribosomal peptide synthetase/type I polyketide synthase [Maridesulfovibrio sp.]
MSEYNTADFIAIIGIGCRFPGAKDKDTFWDNLRNGVDVLAEYTDDELIANGVLQETLSDPDYVKRGYPIENIESFDADFFGYSAAEALRMDPQQRIFLQCAWAALEDGALAGIKNTRTGVFAATKMSSYLDTMVDPNTTGTSAAFGALIGNDKDYIATRTSFKLGLTGPSVTVQSACSSSLAAVHMAIQSLLTGECDTALAGGASITVPQHIGYIYEEGMICSPDAKCRAFDENAQGICAGNGVGVVLLKPLEDALRDKDYIYAVIRGSAMNNDGSDKAGFTAPSVSGQSEVIQDALSLADISARDISYLEAHGTGTALGDPIEIQALTNAYRKYTQDCGYCAIASVKTNVGHLDTAAGVCSLIKTALALKHAEMPPSLHFNKPNPRIPFETTPFLPIAELRPWNTDDGKRFAGVSSFGVGGSNVHIILESPPVESAPKMTTEEEQFILPVSAKNEESLSELCSSLAQNLKKNPTISPASVMRTLCKGRRHFDCRTAVFGENCHDLAEKLKSPVINVATSKKPRIGFMFTGQGSQYAGMGKGLYQSSKVFSKAVDKVAEAMQDHLDTPLFNVLFNDNTKYLEDTKYAQPAIFAIEYGLYKHWFSLGITPHAVMGHSIGEYAAACAANVMPLQTSARLICLRGALCSSLPAGGGMTAFFTDKENLQKLTNENSFSNLDIAAINGPEHTVLAGPLESLKKFESIAEGQDIIFRSLDVSHAFHSHQLDPIVSEFEREVRTVDLNTPVINYISCVTGQQEPKFITDSEYWADHLRQPVQFTAAAKALLETGCDIILEVGPHAVLEGMAKRFLAQDTQIISSMRKGVDPKISTAATTAELYKLGSTINWTPLVSKEAQMISLPTYAFKKDVYWAPRSIKNNQHQIEAMSSQEINTPEISNHPLQLRRENHPLPTFKATIDVQRVPALQNHIINGKHMAPLGVLATLMSDVWKNFKGDKSAISLENIKFKAPVLLSSETPVSVHILPNENGEIKILQENKRQWLECTTAEISADIPTYKTATNIAAGETSFSPDMFPPSLQSMGKNAEGAPLWRFENIRVTENAVHADIILEKELLAGGGGLDVHPSLIDPGIQLLGAFPELFSPPCILAPINARSVSFHNSHDERLKCSVQLHENNPESVLCDIVLSTPEEQRVLTISGMELVRIPDDAKFSDHAASHTPKLTFLDWQPFEAETAPDEIFNYKRSFALIHSGLSNSFSLDSIGSHPVRSIKAENMTTETLENLEEELFTSKGHSRDQQLDIIYVAQNTDLDEHVRFFSYLSNFSSVRSLILAVSGAISVAGESTKPEQRAIWELARVFATENPQTTVTSINLNNWNALQEAVLNVLDQSTPCGQYVYRRGQLLTPVLKSLDAEKSISRFRSNMLAVPQGKTALISGATGGLGRALIKRLIQNGCRNFLLTSRNEPKSPVQKEWEGLRKQNIQIHFYAADIAKRDDVNGLFKNCGKAVPEIGAVYHLAGESNHSPVANLTPEEFRRRTSAKIKGASLLHEMTTSMEPDIFVMFSSIATLHGIANAGAYSAANGYLEALSEMRQAQGLPSTCICWGPFNDCGMLKDDEHGHEQRESIGIHALNADSAITVLESIPQSAPVLHATANNWPLFYDKMSVAGNEPWFSLSEQIAAQKDSKQTDSIQTHEECISDNLEAFLIKSVSDLLKSNSSPTIEENLLMSGLDSLLFLQLSQKLRKKLGVKLSPAEVFANPTIKNICELVRTKTGIAETTNPAPKNKTEGRTRDFELTDTQYAYWAGRSSSLPLGDVSCHSYAEYDFENLDRQRYSASWDELIKRHPMLRMTITADGMQRTSASVPTFEIKHHDLRELSEETGQQKMNEVRNELSHKVHDTSKWPLYTVQTVRLSEDITRICVSIDLLLADARSLQIIMRELRDIYEAAENKSPEKACSQGLFNNLDYTFEQYMADHKQWQNSVEGRQALEAASTYWDERLPELPHGPDLPLAVAPETITSPKFKQHLAIISKDKWNTLKKKAQTKGFTASLLLMAVYADVLARWNCSNNFCLNITLFNRQPYHAQVNDIVGDFTSLSLLEINHAPSKPFQERVAAIQNRFWQDMEYSSLTGVQVIRRLTRSGRMSFGESYPVVFTSNISGSSGPRLLEAMGERGFNISQTPQVWLDNQVHEEQGELVIHWDAVDELFHESMIDDMLAAYVQILESLAESDSAWQQNSFDVLPRWTANLIEKMNKTEAELPPKTLFSLFQDALRTNPNGPAVITSEGLWTYAKLTRQAEAVAQWLEKKDITAGTPVGISIPKGAMQIATVVGICASGAAFVPIDHELPELRRETLIKEAGLKIVLTEEIVSALQPDHDEEKLLDRTPAQPDELAYVIYTSGSTGKPKGVAISHEAAVNTVLDINRRYSINRNDRIFGVSRLTFDLSVYDIFGAFAAGAALVLPDDKGQRDPAHWLECLSLYQCTAWNSAPALLQLAIEYAESSNKYLPLLRTVMLSGDKISPDTPARMKKIATNSAIHSLGGATEASIWSISLPITDHRPSDGPIPYGYPMDNQQWYVLDESLHPCPAHVLGDLYIGGKGLAMGYYKDKTRTDKAFIHHPDTGQRLYRTGDLGTVTAEGILTIAGRRDFQIKVNGHRVEPAEVEYIMGNHAKISNLSVVALRTGATTKLVCYYIGTAREEELRDYASKMLPRYMVPSHFMQLEEFPVTPSGKIDRKALPEPTKETSSPMDGEPRLNETEMKVAEIWNSLLQREKTHPEMDFFSAGGDSVLAARITLELRKAFDTEFALPRFFESPTIRGLANHFRTQEEHSTDSREKQKAAKEPEKVVDILHTSVLAKHPSANSIGSLVPANLVKLSAVKPVEIKKPFITGATGFVGSHILAALLKSQVETIFCLVRAKDKEHGLERILKTASDYSLDFQKDLHKIEVIPGDLSEERYGLSPDEFEHLADEADSIFHSGALVHYIYSYETLLGPNVRGVREAVRLACTGRLKHIHHISTVSVFSPIRAETSLRIYEEEPIDQDMQVFGGYPQSKWIAEKVLNQAAEHGVPVSIYRPGLVTGSSRTGGWNKEDFLYRIVKGSMQAGCFPDLDRTENFLPVDVVGEAITHIALSNSDKRFFNIDGFNPVQASTLIAAMHKAGAQLDVVPYGEWRKRIEKPGNSLLPLLPIFPQKVDPEKISRQLVFDNTNAKEALDKSTIVFPKIEELLPVYLRTLMTN